MRAISLALGLLLSLGCDVEDDPAQPLVPHAEDATEQQVSCTEALNCVVDHCLDEDACGVWSDCVASCVDTRDNARHAAWACFANGEQDCEDQWGYCTGMERDPAWEKVNDCEPQ